jgi:hypothetical protein
MALLLGKYDSNVSLAAGNVRQQVDHLVDELFERVIVCAQLDPPSKHMSCFMFNVDTHEFEPYPEGWWKQVIEVNFTHSRSCLCLSLPTRMVLTHSHGSGKSSAAVGAKWLKRQYMFSSASPGSNFFVTATAVWAMIQFEASLQWQRGFVCLLAGSSHMRGSMAVLVPGRARGILLSVWTCSQSRSSPTTAAAAAASTAAAAAASTAAAAAASTAAAAAAAGHAAVTSGQGGPEVGVGQDPGQH